MEVASQPGSSCPPSRSSVQRRLPALVWVHEIKHVGASASGENCRRRGHTSPSICDPHPTLVAVTIGPRFGSEGVSSMTFLNDFFALKRLKLAPH